MGLAGRKNRTKLSKDPNNTAWANSDTYGHKILRSQGWQPGDYLGARDASHADHYTTANASHIRVLLREDNLGIGAQKGKANAQTFGLSLFSGLLGRLNGKSDEIVQKQESAMRDVELRTFTSQKYGFMNFVRGGLLVGDKIEETVGNISAEPDTQLQRKKRKIEDVDELEGSDKVEKRMKRRDQKADDASHKNDGDTTRGRVEASGPRQRSKERKRRKNRPGDLQQEPELAPVSDSTLEKKKSGKEKRKKSRLEDVQSEANGSESKAERRRLREEKRARKEERRRQKEEKRRLKPGDDETPSATVTTTASAITSANTSGTSTPQLSSMAFGGSRHAVRQRYIQQKRLASMNAQSLNEIFMLKSAA